MGVLNLNARIFHKIHPDGTVEYYNSKTRPAVNSGLPHTQFDKLIKSIAHRYNVDPHLIKCMVKVESGFKTNAVSKAGAMGLMQLMQSTAEYYNVKNPFDPEQNLTAGIRHFASLMRYFKNDTELSLAAYHAGRGRVARGMKIPPIKSTVDYVNRIMRLYNGCDADKEKIQRIYTRIEPDGTLLILSK